MKRYEIKEIGRVLKELDVEHGARSFLGALSNTEGILILMFSHRLNRDFPFLVQSTDFAATVAAVEKELELESSAITPFKVEAIGSLSGGWQ